MAKEITEDTDDFESVFYCSKCGSLKIMVGENGNPDICGVCGSTEISEAINIDTYLQLKEENETWKN